MENSPRIFNLFHPAGVLLMMFVNAAGIVILLVTYILGHNLLGFNLIEALIVWYAAQFALISMMIR